MPAPDRDRVREYHERTKHHPERYARSLGYMDWDNQPEPFRTYDGAPRVPLPLLPEDPPGDQASLYESVPPCPFNLARVAGFLELSLALSAWKSAQGARWALRINPSSGNLHPTEAHLVLPSLEGCEAGVYHYAPLHHALECRARAPAKLRQVLADHFGADGFLIGLTGIFWREAWKYGERAFRYCNLDAGHALAALRFAAGLFGWRLTALTALSDAETAAVLGLDRAVFPPGDEEHPEVLCRVHTAAGGNNRQDLPADAIDLPARPAVAARPNRLSREHVGWEIIDVVREASAKPRTSSPFPSFSRRTGHTHAAGGLSAAAIIRRRRSAVAFTPAPPIVRADFLAMLDRTLPRDGTAPFDVGLGPTAVHLVLFVHAVDGLDPGLYVLARADDDLASLRAAMQSNFLWTPVEPAFPLYLLQRGDFRRTAAFVSCGQDIAGASAFSLGMLARFAETITAAPHRYRSLFQECGMIGQVLYLEAEAHGLRGTGIGCFFDDAVHDLLGLEDDRWQSLYHFTIGHPLEDRRLTTLPPY